MRRITPAMLVFILLFAVYSPIAYAQEGNISVSVQRIDRGDSLTGIILMAAAMLALLIVFFVLLRYIFLEKRKKRALKEKVKVMDKDEADYYRENREDMDKEEKTFSIEEDIDKYLKEDERIVVNILRQRGGICSQSTLRIAGNFSKATLSRLLVELEQRNIIKKEKRGKKNLVILR